MWPFPLVLPVFFQLWFALMIVLLQPGWVAAAETADVDVGLYALGAFPSDHGLFAQGGNPSDTRITNGAGAGIKASVFPHGLGNIVGIGLESSGHGSEITFSSARAGSLPSTNLWVFSSMVNLTLRYPREGVCSLHRCRGWLFERSAYPCRDSWSFGSRL